MKERVPALKGHNSSILAIDEDFRSKIGKTDENVTFPPPRLKVPVSSDFNPRWPLSADDK